MSDITVTQGFTLIYPGCCNSQFAVSDSIYRKWQDTKQRWHCPHCGNRRFFTGESEEQKLRDKLRQQENDLEEELDRIPGSVRGIKTYSKVSPICNKR